MNNHDYKSDADFARELKERQRLLQKTPENYISYPSGEPGKFIHEFVGGRRVLVEIDEETGKERFLREL